VLSFVAIAAIIGLGMLVWDCVEIGRNDAANLVNAVFGARVLRRRVAVMIAGVAVVLGATFSSPVMETARKGIFDPTVLTVGMAISIYISVYFVDTVLLYTFSGFGMPVSTTACLLFSMVGGSLFLAGPGNVQWPKVGEVAVGIILSIIISGIMSFMVMRVFRGAIRDKAQDRETLLLHGPWVAGALLTWLAWFMVFKGLKNVGFVKAIRAETFQAYGEWLVLLLMWSGFTLATYIAIAVSNQERMKYLFHATAILGMICMAFAFGQNDLANAASPGLASLTLWRNSSSASDLANVATAVAIPMWALFVCGLLIASGMFTNYAQRVTRAEVNTGSQFESVSLYAPNWCRAIARVFVRMRGSHGPLAPALGFNERGKKVHYDTLRASVITSVSAGVIAFASGRGLPVSTTYVAFAAVLGTGLADRVFVRGEADKKMGRAIWVVTCWFLSPLIAMAATGILATLVYRFAVAGLAMCFAINLTARWYFRRRADAHESKYHPQASKRKSALDEEDDESPALDEVDEPAAATH